MTSAPVIIVSMSPPGYPSAGLLPSRARFCFTRQRHCNSKSQTAWRGPRRLGMTLRVSAADPFGQLTGASVFVGGIALVKSRS